MLRNIPLILVGGLRAWKARFGPEELVRGGIESAMGVQDYSSGLLQTIDGTFPMQNGHSSPRPNGPPLPSSAPLAPLPMAPVSGHFRAPAESSTSTILTSPPIETTNFGRNGPLSPTLQDSNTYQMWVPPPTATPVPPDSIPLSLRYATYFNILA